MTGTVLLGQSGGLLGQSGDCGGGSVCEEVFARTDNLVISRVVGWLATSGLLIVLILVAALLLARLVRRQGPRLVALYINREEASFQQLEASDLTEDKRVDHALRLEHTRQRAATLGEVGGQIAAGVIWFVAVLLVLDQVGINLAPLLAGAGVIGIAIGFGAQRLIRDYLNGFFIVLEDQYGVGDIVTIGDATGTVERVSLRVTKLRDLDGTVWFIPNGELTSVGNRSQLWARAVLDIEVSYQTDLEQAGRILLDVAKELWREQRPDATIIAEPEFWGVERFGADGVTLRLVVRTEPTEQWQTARELRSRVKTALDEAGIEIPFPQRTVWLNDGSEPAPPEQIGEHQD